MTVVPGLTGQVVGGTLRDGVSLRGVQYRDAHRQIDADAVDASWQLHFSPLALTVNSLRVRQLDVALTADDEAAQSPPQRVVLPLAIDVRDVSIALLNLHRGEPVIPVEDIHLAGKSDRVHHELNLHRATTPWGVVRIDVGERATIVSCEQIRSSSPGAC